MNDSELLYISDEHGTLTSVVVPISLWREIHSELETHHLLKSETMRQRLLRSRGQVAGIPFDDVLNRLGLDQPQPE